MTDPFSKFNTANTLNPTNGSNLTGKLLISIEITHQSGEQKQYQLFKNKELNIIETLSEQEINIPLAQLASTTEIEQAKQNLSNQNSIKQSLTKHYIIEKFVTQATLTEEQYEIIRDTMVKHKGDLRVLSMRSNFNRYNSKLSEQAIKYRLICGLEVYELVFIDIITECIESYSVINKLLRDLKFIEETVRKSHQHL